MVRHLQATASSSIHLEKFLLRAVQIKKKWWKRISILSILQRSEKIFQFLKAEEKTCISYCRAEAISRHGTKTMPGQRRSPDMAQKRCRGRDVFPTWHKNDAGAEAFSRHGTKTMSGKIHKIKKPTGYGGVLSVSFMRRGMFYPLLQVVHKFPCKLRNRRRGLHSLK